jgi:hypothetical protein
MKNLALALAAATTLAATSAFAASVDEIAQDKNLPVQIVSAPELATSGQGAVTNSEQDGEAAPARIDSVRLVQYPDSARPTFDRGR